MPDDLRLARFTREVASDGVLDEMLKHLPPEEVAPALAGLAKDRGYAVDIGDLKLFLSGLDCRQA